MTRILDQKIFYHTDTCWYILEDTRPIEENEEEVEPEDASNDSQEDVDVMLEDEGVLAFLVRDPNNPANSFLVPATSVKDYHWISELILGSDWKS